MSKMGALVSQDLKLDNVKENWSKWTKLDEVNENWTKWKKLDQVNETENWTKWTKLRTLVENIGNFYAKFMQNLRKYAKNAKKYEIKPKVRYIAAIGKKCGMSAIEGKKCGTALAALK